MGAYPARTALYQIRKALTNPRISQEQLAILTGVSRQWYHLLETGKQERISYTTANALIKAINNERQIRGLSTLTINHLNLTIV